LVAGASAGTINCHGGTTTLTASGSGGTPGYTYSTHGITFQAGTAFNNVPAGSYTVTVKDSNGCTDTQAITISEPTVLVAGASAGTINCHGGTTTLTASGSGGTPGYTYSTNGITFQAGTAFNNVPAGSYTVTVKDSNGCTDTQAITISEPTVLVAGASAGTINCHGGTTTLHA